MAASERDEQHGLTDAEARGLRAELQQMSTLELTRMVAADAKTHPAIPKYVKDRRRFDRITASRVELFSRLRAPVSSFGRKG